MGSRTSPSCTWTSGPTARASTASWSARGPRAPNSSGAARGRSPPTMAGSPSGTRTRRPCASPRSSSTWWCSPRRSARRTGSATWRAPSHGGPPGEPLAGIEPPRVGVFVCHCGSNIAGVVDVPRVVQFAKTLPDVVWAQNQMFSCAGNTQKEIEDAIRSKGINRVVVAACSPKTHEGIFRKVLIRAGLNPFLLEMANVRNQDSWVHKAEKEAATLKAMDMVWMGVEKARRLVPLEITQTPVTQAALVVGGGIAGMMAAPALARQGYETHLVEKETKLGGLLRHLDVLAPSGLKAQELLELQEQELHDAGVHLHLGTEVEQIGGFVGNFAARLSSGEDLRVGAVVLATGR